MDIVNVIPWKEVLGVVIGALGYVWGWFEKNKDKIQAVILRVEKESQDGWTATEKEQVAVDLFFTEIYPTLPWYVKMIPRSLIESQIRAVIKDVCNRSHKLKDKVQTVTNGGNK